MISLGFPIYVVLLGFLVGIKVASLVVPAIPEGFPYIIAAPGDFFVNPLPLLVLLWMPSELIGAILRRIVARRRTINAKLSIKINVRLGGVAVGMLLLNYYVYETDILDHGWLLFSFRFIEWKQAAVEFTLQVVVYVLAPFHFSSIEIRRLGRARR